MKLKILLQYKYRYLYIAFALSLFILVNISYWYLIVVFPFGYYIYNNHKDLIRIIGVVIIIYIASIYLFNRTTIELQEEYKVTVVNEIKYDIYSSFVGKIDNKLIKVYFDEKITVRPGDVLIIKGEVKEVVGSTIPNTFDYSNYLKSQGIKYTVFTKSINIESSSITIELIPYYIEKYIGKHLPLSGKYVKTFILAEKGDISVEVKDNINKIGISHLFAVSGLHIAILVMSFSFILKKTSLAEIIRENLIIVLLIMYLVVTSFSPSVTRASFMYVLLIINKRLKLDFSSLDILSLIFIILLFIRPYYYYDAGFLLSFLVTFTIILSNQIINKESKLQQLFLISLLAFIITLPLILKLNYQVNILSIFLNIIFLLYVSYIILPLSYAAFIIPLFDKINYFFIIIFEYVLEVVSKIDFLIFEVYFSNHIYIIIYYLIVFMLFMSIELGINIKRYSFILVIFLFFINISPFLDIRKSVSFISIYGDSTLIKDSFNRCNILIDTGETDDYNAMINYLKAKNINKLDYLIISHFHSDHYGEANDLLEEIEVDIVLSKHNVYQYEGKNIDCGSISMYIYPFDYLEKNENNNSIIMSIFISDKHYLFTGDIELSRELEFTSKYDLDIDYLKVAHHGSITSSNQSFLDGLSIKEAFIIVSSKNTHGHPHNDVINRFNEMDVYVNRTDIDGTIEVYYIFGKEYKRIHSP